MPEEVWRKRYDHINAFEKLLADSGVTIVKFYLHISKEEQKARLLERQQTPEKQWKFAPGDLEERKRWGSYMEAFEEALTRCNKSHALVRHPLQPQVVPQPGDLRGADQDPGKTQSALPGAAAGYCLDVIQTSITTGGAASSAPPDLSFLHRTSAGRTSITVSLR